MGEYLKAYFELVWGGLHKGVPGIPDACFYKQPKQVAADHDEFDLAKDTVELCRQYYKEYDQKIQACQSGHPIYEFSIEKGGEDDVKRFNDYILSPQCQEVNDFVTKLDVCFVRNLQRPNDSRDVRYMNKKDAGAIDITYKSVHVLFPPNLPSVKWIYMLMRHVFFARVASDVYNDEIPQPPGEDWTDELSDSWWALRANMDTGHWLMFNGYVKPQYDQLAAIPLDEPAFYFRPEVVIQKMLDMWEGMENWSERVKNPKDAEFCAKKVTLWKKIQIDQNYEEHDIHMSLPPVLERAADPDEGRPNIFEQIVADLPAADPVEPEPELHRVEINLDPPPIDIDLEESHAEEAKRQQMPEPQYTSFEPKREAQAERVGTDDDESVIMEDPPIIAVEKPIWSYVISAGVLIGLAWLLLQDTDREY